MATDAEVRKIMSAVAKAAADILSREENDSLTAEDLAESLAQSMTESMVSAYEAIQAKAYNLVVLGHFRLSETESYVAAVGPLSTRATVRARGVGERFAWDYRTKTGTGKYVLVPLIRNPNDAWDHVRNDARPPEEVQESLRRAYSLSADPFGPACSCGLPDHPRYNTLGDPADLTCPRHPEKESHG